MIIIVVVVVVGIVTTTATTVGIVVSTVPATSDGRRLRRRRSPLQLTHLSTHIDQGNARRCIAPQNQRCERTPSISGNVGRRSL